MRQWVTGSFDCDNKLSGSFVMSLQSGGSWGAAVRTATTPANDL